MANKTYKGDKILTAKEALLANERPSVAYAEGLNKTEPPARWQNWRPIAFDSVSNGLETASTKLNQVQSLLASGVDLLESVQSVIKLLAMFESMFKTSIFSFLHTIINEIENFLNDVRSTGIYFLDLVSYHWDDEPQEEQDNNARYKNFIFKKDGWYSKAGEKLDIAEGDIPTQAEQYNVVDDYVDHYTKHKFFDIKGDFSDNIKDLNINFKYKKESYNDFVDVVCNALMNEKDIPASSLITFNPHISKVQNEKILLQKTKESFSFRKDPGNEFLRSGRPNFGPNGHLEAVVFSMASNDIFKIFNLIGTFAKLGLDLFPGNSTKKAFEELEKIYKEKDKKGESFWYQEDENASYDLGLVKLYGEYDPRRTPPELSQQRPYFLGLTVGTLFGDLFDEAQKVLNWLKSIDVKIDHSILKMIDDVIDGIIADLEKIIAIIETIDSFINTIKNFLEIAGMSMLHVSSDEGNVGLVEAIRDAKGFKEEEVVSKEFDQINNDITNIQNQIDLMDADVNMSFGEITKLKKQFNNEGLYYAWKPNNFVYDPGFINSIEWPDNINSKGQDLYIKLWEEEIHYEDVKTKSNNLWINLNEKNNSLIDLDVGISETYKRAKIKQELESLNNEIINLSDEQDIYDAQKSHLRSIKNATINYGNYLIINNIDNKLSQKESLSQPSAEENEAYADYLLIVNNGIDFDGDGIYEYGLEYYKNFKDSIIEDKNNYIDGIDFDNDGIYEQKPIDTQIQDIQDEIDVLTAQQNDTSSPDVLDFDARIEDLNTSKNNLEEAKSELISDYDTEITRFEAIINEIETLDVNDYNSYKELALDNTNYATNNIPKGIVQLKNDLVNYDYNNKLSALNTQISELELLREQYLNNIITYNTELSLASAPLYVNLDDPTNYFYDSAFPDVNVDTELPYLKINIDVNSVNIKEENPYKNTLNIHVFGIVIAERQNISVGDLSNIYAMYKWQKLKTETEIKYNNIQTQLNIINDLKTNLENDFEIFESNNIELQEDRQYIYDIISVEIAMSTLNSDYLALKSTRENSLNIISDEINNIYSEGYNNYLQLFENYYNKNLDYPEKIHPNWSNNELFWLEKYYNWNKDKPDFEISGGEIFVDVIDNGINAIDKKIADIQINLDIQNQSYVIAQEKEQQRKDNWETIRKEELFNKKQEKKSWTRDTKMYYGGFMIAFGWPTTDEKYFNINDHVKHSFTDPDSDVKTDAQQFLASANGSISAAKNVGKVFKKLFGMEK